MLHPILRRALAAPTLLGLLCVSSVETKQVVRTGGPPPAVRAIIDELLAAVNTGTADDWEKYAQERFSAELLREQTVGDRRQLFERIRAQFGTITPGGVNREGPSAPLELTVTGTRASGVIAIGLDNSSPPRVSSLKVNAGPAGPPRDPNGVALPPVHGRMSSDDLSRVLDKYFTGLAAADTFSGVALVAKDGVPVFHNAYGLADRARKIPNTVRTRFNIGSINKAFTRVAIEQLVRDGKLAYSDTLGKFFPEYPQEMSRAATVEQLLNHTGGLADFFGPLFTSTAKDRFRSNADYFRFISGLPPVFAPGTREQYCNGCYIALGAVIEKVSSIPYEQYVAEHVFRRAEMTNTGYPHTDALEADIATGYTHRGGDGTLRSNVYLHGAAGSAAGGGYATALDLLLYVKAVRAGRFPGADADMGIAGGAPGTSAAVEANGQWTVIVLTNLDPPTGEQIGVGLMRALTR
jgi:CubicO group peptidase (beta-lactamase class C family)